MSRLEWAAVAVYISTAVWGLHTGRWPAWVWLVYLAWVVAFSAARLLGWARDQNE